MNIRKLELFKVKQNHSIKYLSRIVFRWFARNILLIGKHSAFLWFERVHVLQPYSLSPNSLIIVPNWAIRLFLGFFNQLLYFCHCMLFDSLWPFSNVKIRSSCARFFAVRQFSFLQISNLGSHTYFRLSRYTLSQVILDLNFS